MNNREGEEEEVSMTTNCKNAYMQYINWIKTHNLFVDTKLTYGSIAKFISKYKRIICSLRNYSFRFQEKNLKLDWDLNLGPPDL